MCEWKNGVGGRSNSVMDEDAIMPVGKRSAKDPASYKIPSNIGVSKVDKMDHSVEELKSKEFLEKCMICPVCQWKGTKLRDVVNCLRLHGIYRCALCYNTYKSREDSLYHMDLVHSAGPGMSKCVYCPRSFSNIGQVAGHTAKMHLPVIFGRKMDEEFITKQAQPAAATAIDNKNDDKSSAVKARGKSVEGTSEVADDNGPEYLNSGGLSDSGHMGSTTEDIRESNDADDVQEAGINDEGAKRY